MKVTRRNVTTAAGEDLGAGDLVATRRNDRDLDVANRDTWTVTSIGTDGALHIRGSRGRRTLPADYARTHVAHLVAPDLAQARQHWIRVFARDRADLGPAMPPPSPSATSTPTAPSGPGPGTQNGRRTPGRSPAAASPAS